MHFYVIILINLEQINLSFCVLSVMGLFTDE